MSATFLDRLNIEKKDLDEKLEKIHAFIESPAFDELEIASQKWLSRQSHVMDLYSDILNERIEYANNPY